MILRASFEPRHGRITRRTADRSIANPQATGSSRANPPSDPRRYEPPSRPRHPQSGRSGAACETDPVPETADPSPVIGERLAALAAEYEPRIEQLKIAIKRARSDETRELKAELKRSNRAYASARRE